MFLRKSKGEFYPQNRFTVDDGCIMSAIVAPVAVSIRSQRYDDQSARVVAGFVGQPDLHRFTRHVERNTGFESPIKASDRNQFGIETGTEDTRVFGPAGAGQCATA